MGCCNSNIKTLEYEKNSQAINKASNLSNQISFRCIYDVKDYHEIRIINDTGYKDYYIPIINEEIKSKIKIINNNNKEELIFNKKFDKLAWI